MPTEPVLDSVVVLAFVTLSTLGAVGVGDGLRPRDAESDIRARGVRSSSSRNPPLTPGELGKGGTSSDSLTGAGLLGRDRDLDLDDDSRSGMVKMSENFLRVEVLGVEGCEFEWPLEDLDVEDPSVGGGAAVCGLFCAFGVPGVIVVLVAVVVEERGRD